MKLFLYKIENLLNCKKYIGFTANVDKRLKLHFSQLRRNIHHSEKLQRAFNKYGESNFSTEILLEIECEYDHIKKLEIEYIKNFNSLDDGYNMTIGGDGVVGITGGNHWNSKKVFVYSRDGDLVNYFHSLAECAIFFNSTTGEISSFLRGKCFIMSDLYYLTSKCEGIFFSGFHKIFKYSLDGYFIESYANTNHAIEKMKLSYNGRNNINSCITNKRNTAFGFIWKHEYVGNNIPMHTQMRGEWSKINQSVSISQIDMKTGLVIKRFNSINEATDSLNISQGSLNSCLNGRSKSAYKYYWKYN